MGSTNFQMIGSLKSRSFLGSGCEADIAFNDASPWLSFSPRALLRRIHDTSAVNMGRLSRRPDPLEKGQD